MTKPSKPSESLTGYPPCTSKPTCLEKGTNAPCWYCSLCTGHCGRLRYACDEAGDGCPGMAARARGRRLRTP